MKKEEAVLRLECRDIFFSPDKRSGNGMRNFLFGLKEWDGVDCEDQWDGSPLLFYSTQ